MTKPERFIENFTPLELASILTNFRAERTVRATTFAGIGSTGETVKGLETYKARCQHRQQIIDKITEWTQDGSDKLEQLKQLSLRIGNYEDKHDPEIVKQYKDELDSLVAAPQRNWGRWIPD
jgi:hypothetical protein